MAGSETLDAGVTTVTTIMKSWQGKKHVKRNLQKQSQND